MYLTVWYNCQNKRRKLTKQLIGFCNGDWLFTARYEFYENFTLQEVIRGLPQSYIKCPNLQALLHALYAVHNMLISILRRVIPIVRLNYVVR